jgi:hypothetical protein
MASPVSPLSSDQRRDRHHPNERSTQEDSSYRPDSGRLLAPCAPDARAAMRVVTFVPQDIWL